MKFLIDAQLPRRLARQLRVDGFETLHTLDLPQGNHTSDRELIEFSLNEHCVVVTKDSDFVESFLLRHEPWKLLLVSTGNIGNDELLRLFRSNINQLANAFNSFDFLELNRTSLIFHF